MKNLSTTLLVEIYQKALITEVDKNFIDLIEKEMNRRLDLTLLKNNENLTFERVPENELRNHCKAN
ncbi:sporulation histidine kinase inhibitor Sda [Halalkalibacter alkaliphilus]|uniref:sporulation histidine kinase inhibitor Sda n=1 Tax=Halalkalibacter alkaliphilus TaxID=2917993 RepID=UPI003B8458CA